MKERYEGESPLLVPMAVAVCALVFELTPLPCSGSCRCSALRWRTMRMGVIGEMPSCGCELDSGGGEV